MLFSTHTELWLNDNCIWLEIPLISYTLNLVLCPGEFRSKVLIGIRHNPIFTTFENKNDVVVTSIVLPIKRLKF